MFSRFVSSLSATVRSPKALLASYLASSLGTFFEVDPDAIELNLLSDTKIVLHHVQLKPQKTHKRTLQGEVDEIEFSWIWGGNGTTAFVRETELTIRGARFRLVISPEEEAVPEMNRWVPPSEPSKAQGDGYMQRQVQQIIDHLALSITDFQLAIETGLENVIFEAKSLQLVSLGYSSDETSEASPLSQQIFLESFCAYLTEAPGKKVDSWSRLPLLDPFMFIASIRRISGRRFDGLALGLEVVGELASGMNESSENVEGITIHAGTAQVQALGRLLEMLAPDGSHQAVRSCNDKDGNGKLADKQNWSGGDEDVIETKNEPGSSTSFVMSFPSIELILPNESKIRTPNCTLRYCMDGTMCTVEGKEGIMINDYNFLLLEDDVRWLVDFTRSIFLLEKRLVTMDGKEAEQWEDAVADFDEANLASKVVVARVLWLEREMKQLLHGVREILYSSSVFNGDIFHEEDPSSGSDPSTWAVTVAGMLSARIEGDSQKEYIEACLLSPSLLLSQEKSTNEWILKQIDMEGASIGPSSFGDISVSIPPLEMARDRDEIYFEGCVEATVQTTSAIEDAQQFLLRALCPGAGELKSAPSRDKLDFPFAICVPAVTIDVSTPETHIAMDEVKIRDSTVCCGRLRYADEAGTAAYVSGLKATFLPDIEAKLQQIESLHIPGILDLAKPIDDTILSFRKGVFQIDMPYAQVLLAKKKDGLPTIQQQAASATPKNASLPFPLRLRLPELRLQTQCDADCFIIVRSIDLAVWSMNESIVMNNDGDVNVHVEASDNEWLDSSVADPSIILSPSNDGFSLNSMTCANVHVGSSAFGHISVDVPSIGMRSGSEELCVSGVLTVSLKSMDVASRIQSFLARLLGNDSSSSSSVPLTLAPSRGKMDFPFPICVPAVMIDVSTPETHIAMNEVKMRDSTVCCGRLRYTDEAGTAACVSGLKATFLPDIEATLQQIESLHIPGILDLAKPIDDTILSFMKGVFQIDMPYAQVLLTEKKEGLTARQQQAASATPSNAALPFPVRLRLPELRLQTKYDMGCFIIVRSIDLAVLQLNESIKINNDGDVNVRVEASDDEWLDSSVAGPSIILSPSNDGFSLSSMTCANVHVGSSAFGHISVDVPSIGMRSGSEELCFGGVVTVSLKSMDVASRIQSFLARFLGNDSSSSSSVPLTLAPSRGKMDFPFPICVPAVTIDVSTPETHIAMNEVKMRDSTVCCGRLRYTDEAGTAACVSGLKATFLPDIEATLQQIESLHIPGILDLAKQIDDTILSFSKGVFQIDMPYAQVLIAEKKDGLPARQQQAASATPNNAALPFPVRLRLPELRLQTQYDADCFIIVRSIDLAVWSLNESIVINNDGDVNVRVEASDDEWLDSSVAGPSIILSPSNDGFSPSSITCANVHVGSSAFGHISVDVPSVRMRSGSEELCFGRVVTVSLKSMDVVSRIQSFLARLLGNDSCSLSSLPLTQAPSRGKMDFPFPICVPAVTIDVSTPETHIAMDEVKMRDSTVCCGRLRYTDEAGIAACVSGLKATFLPDIEATLQQIESLHIPGILDLAKPIDDTILSFMKGVFQIDMQYAQVLIAEKKDGLPTRQQQAASATPNNAVLPFPVRLRLPELRLQTQYDAACFIIVRSIDLAVSPMNESIVINNDGDVNVRVEASDDEWLDSSVAGPSVTLLPSNGGLSLSSMTCANVHVGSSAFGHISVDVPSVGMRSGSEELCVNGVLTVSLKSMDVASRIQSFLARLLGNGSSSSPSLPLTLIVPNLTLSISEIGAQVTVNEVKVKGSEVSCDFLSMIQSNGTAASVSGISGTFGEVVMADLEWIETLYLPGAGALDKPVNHTRLAFDGEVLQIYMPSTRVVLLANVDCERKIDDSKGGATLPFPISLNINEVTLIDAKDNEQICCHQVELDAKPIQCHPPVSWQPGTMVTFRVHEVENKMMKLDAVRSSAIIYSGEIDTVHNFTISTSSAVVVAGFSSIDWSNMLGDDTGQQTNSVMLLPFACIDTFTAHLSYAGKVVSTHDSVCIPGFQGGPSTTLNDIIGHVTSAVLSKAPSIIANMEVLGENVGEMTAKNVGRMAASASLRGAAVGSVAGLVAVDSIRGAVAKGKRSRNASSNDAYKFGDFTRGSVRSIKQAVTDPKTASKTVGKYAGDNKSRLGSAGASGIGMAVGSALLGPVGFVVGGYLGSRAGQKAFEDAPVSQEEVLVQTEARDSNDEHPSRNHEPVVGVALFDGNPPAVSPSAATCDSMANQGKAGSHVCVSQKEHAISDSDWTLMGLASPTKPLTDAIPPAASPNAAVFDPFADQGAALYQTCTAPPECVKRDDRALAMGSPKEQVISDSDWALMMGLTSPAKPVAAAIPPAASPNAAVFDPLANHGPMMTQTCMSPPACVKSDDWATAMGLNAPAASPWDAMPPAVPPNAATTTGLYQAQHRVENVSSSSTTPIWLQDKYASTSNSVVKRGAHTRLNPSPHADTRAQHQGTQDAQQGYHFGDITRSVVSRGKQKAGRNEKDGYKFGDFTRGLFG